MHRTEPVPKQLVKYVNQQIATKGMRKTSAELGLHHNTLTKIQSGKRCSPSTITALRAKLRDASEFASVQSKEASLVRPRQILTRAGWTLDQIRDARNAQMNGQFDLPAQLVTAFACDDALFAARQNRTAPIAAIPYALESAGGARGEVILKRAEKRVTIPRHVVKSIVGTVADHAVAVAINRWVPLEDGRGYCVTLEQWPIQHTRWHEPTRELQARIVTGEWVPIKHGDGLWTVFQQDDNLPWSRDAVVLPGSLVFMAHFDVIKSWAATARSHGMAKIIGEMPADTPIRDDLNEGQLTPEAENFLAILSDIVSGESAAAIRPAGSKTDFVVNTSSAWQVFLELANDRTKAAFRIYNGTDGALGAQGGAPGVDISALFAVATTKIQADLLMLESAIVTGVLQPWTALNSAEEDSAFCPRLKFAMPDPDRDAKVKESSAAYEGFFSTIDNLRTKGFTVDQDVIDRVAKEFGVKTFELAAQNTSFTLTPSDIASVVTGAEARASLGLQPFNDSRDNLTVKKLNESQNTPAPADGVQSPA